MKTIAHNINGKLALTHICADMSIADYANKHLNGEFHYLDITNKKDLPDFYFLDAFKLENFEISVDLDKAKEIQRNRFRAARTPILAKLDIEFMKAVEFGDSAKQAEIAGYKRSLRDVTDLPLPDDLTELKNFWPAVLGERPA